MHAATGERLTSDMNKAAECLSTLAEIAERCQEIMHEAYERYAVLKVPELRDNLDSLANALKQSQMSVNIAMHNLNAVFEAFPTE